VIRDLRNHRTSTFKAIADSEGDISEEQVRRIATGAGYHRRVARRKPFLGLPAIRTRRAWVRENAERDWSKVIWTDETTLELGKRVGHLRVTRKAGEEFLPENIELTFWSGRKSLMLWGCVAEGRKGPLIWLDLNVMPEQEGSKGGKKKGKGGLKKEQYVSQVLEGPLLEFYTTLNKERGGGMLVVEDGA
ncbi:hypothetical protein L227DRAFT_471647, partial [Lentinus tigrinus ALCF2SS1-6]